MTTESRYFPAPSTGDLRGYIVNYLFFTPATPSPAWPSTLADFPLVPIPLNGLAGTNGTNSPKMCPKRSMRARVKKKRKTIEFPFCSFAVTGSSEFEFVGNFLFFFLHSRWRTETPVYDRNKFSARTVRKRFRLKQLST